jgi:hypothetical protein
MEDDEYILVQRYKNDDLVQEIPINREDKNKIFEAIKIMENFLGVEVPIQISNPQKVEERKLLSPKNFQPH